MIVNIKDKIKKLEYCYRVSDRLQVLLRTQKLLEISHH